jgi:hypothetical protein
LRTQAQLQQQQQHQQQYQQQQQQQAAAVWLQLAQSAVAPSKQQQQQQQQQLKQQQQEHLQKHSQRVREIAVQYADEWSQLFRNDWEMRQEAAQAALLESIDSAAATATAHLDISAALAAADLAEFESDIVRFEQYSSGKRSAVLSLLLLLLSML